MAEYPQADGRLDYKRVLPVVIIVLVDMIGLSIIIPLLPLYAARYGANAFLTGVLGATYPFMQFIGAPVLGRLSDRWGRRPVLLISQAGTFAGFILLAIARSLPVIFLARIVDGISGANISTAQAVISDLTTEKTRTQGLGLIGAAFGLGFILGPILSFVVLSLTYQSYVAVALTAAGFSFLSILLTFFMLPETRPSAPDVRRQAPFTLQALFTTLQRPAIGLLLILMFIQQLAFGGYEHMFSLFTLSRLGLSARDNSALFIYLGLLIVIIQGGLIGRWSRRHGDRWLVWMGFLALAMGLILTAATPQVPVPWYDPVGLREELAANSNHPLRIGIPEGGHKGWIGILWLILASVPVALGGGVLQPSINSLITQHIEASETGGILGVSSALLSAANAIAPVLYGAIFQTFGAPAPFMWSGLLLLVLWPVVFFRFRNMRPLVHQRGLK